MSYLPVAPTFGRRGDVDTVMFTPQHGIRWETQRMTWRAIGGPYRANIRGWMGIHHLVDMLDYLRNGVKLYDAQGFLCWWGYVHEVRIRWGVSEVGVSLDQMFNRVKVAYKALAPGEDATEDAETDWGEDAASTTEYGDRELVFNAGRLVLTEEVAVQLRDTKLAQAAFPQPVADYESRAADPMVDILCRGWWDTLSWVHYSQSAGRIMYADEGDAAQGIGQSMWTTGSTITWIDSAEGDFIYDTGGGFWRYSVGQIIATGSTTDADNTLAATTILDIYDSTYQRMTLSSDVDTWGGPGTEESIEITPQGIMAGQQFTTGASDDWTIVSVAVRAKTVGSPADTLRLAIYSESGGSPNVSLGSGTLAAASLDGVFRWRTFTLTAPLALAAATNYWIVIDRTGASSADDAYHVELSTDAGYAGNYKYWTGATWTARLGVDMPFDIIGGDLTSTLIHDVLDASAFITEVTVEDASSAITVLTQVEDQTVKSVVEGLLETGTGDDRRLLARMDEHRAVLVYEEPDVEDRETLYRRARDGTLRDHYGAKVEPQRAGEIVGNWLENEDLLAIVAPGSDLTDAGRAFIEEAEWTVAGNAVRLTARGTKNVWEL